MNRLYITLLITVVFTTVSAQENARFIFQEYQGATVFLKDGIRSQEMINFNLMDGKFYYIDQHDGLVKIISNINDISMLKIGERLFIPTKHGIREIISTTPLVYVQYRVKTKMKPQKGALGLETELASIITYSAVGDQANYFSIKDTEWQVIKHYYSYLIEKNNKNREFFNFRQFVKLYPKHKRVLNNYIKSNRIDFNDLKQMVDLCLYAESLDK